MNATVRLGVARSEAAHAFEADVLVGARVVGTVRWAGWDAHLAIQPVELAPDVPDTVEIAVVQALLAPYGASLPVLTHAGVRAATLAWYREGALGPGCVLCGSVDGQAFVYDDLSGVPDARESLVGTVLYAPRFGALLDDPVGVLLHADWLDRTITLRRLAVRGGDVARLDALHHLALTDPHYAVRQFAATQMSALVPRSTYDASVLRMVRAVAHPLEVLDELGVRRPEPFAADHARRNVRFALLWVLGNLAWVGRGYHALDRSREDVLHAVEGALDRGLPGLGPAGDARLLGLAIAECAGALHALGAVEPLSVAELVRYAVHRQRVVAAMGQTAHDRFYWLGVAVDALAQPGTRFEGPLRAPSKGTLPGPGPLPVALQGHNPYAVSG